MTHDKADRLIWPNGTKCALSLTFDDARSSQLDVGLSLLNSYGVRGTFFIVPSKVDNYLCGWRSAVRQGHEMGNHTLSHPCTGNHDWSRGNSLEDHTIDTIREDIVGANERIGALLGVKPMSFAYPCGQSYVGRGPLVRSYVPVVAELFLVGRGWRSEVSNNPIICDLSQVGGIEMDGRGFDDVLLDLETAKAGGRWLILVGHEIGETMGQTTSTATLELLLRNVQSKLSGVWTAPMCEVATYILEHR